MDEKYTNEIMKISIARTCKALGFQYIQNSAMETLSDVIQRYIVKIGSSVVQQVEWSERVHAGIQDVIPVVDGSRQKQSWQELRAFALEENIHESSAEKKVKWSEPFPFDLQYFPVKDPAGKINPIGDSELDLIPVHKDSFIPDHLPSYPPSHTYKKQKLDTLSHKKRKSATIKSNIKINEESDPNLKSMEILGIKSIENSLTKIEDSSDVVLLEK